MILFVTCTTLGWSLAKTQLPWQLTWLSVGACIFILASLLTSPLRHLRLYVLRWLRSDVGAFICVISTAFLVVIAFTWLHIFAKLLLFIAAGTLARLDIQVSGLKKWQAFSILFVVSALGFTLGWGLYYGPGAGLIVHYP